MGLFHRCCLEKWLATSNTRSCEICKHTFRVRMSLPSFWTYLSDPDARTEHKNLIKDVACFLVLTPLTLVSAAMCLVAALNSTTIFPSESVDDVSPMQLEFSLVLLCMTYMLWLFITIIFHYKVFNAWRITNQQIVFQDCSNREDEDLEASSGTRFRPSAEEVRLPMEVVYSKGQAESPVLSGVDFTPATSPEHSNLEPEQSSELRLSAMFRTAPAYQSTPSSRPCL